MVKNPNYPIPEKWYIERTPENTVEVNKLCSKILSVTLYAGSNLTDFHYVIHPFIHSVFSKYETKCFKAPQEGYTEVTYEDLWLAYMIPEKWYCKSRDIDLLNRWQKLQKDFDENYLYAEGLISILSKHHTDRSYYHLNKNVVGTEPYSDYKEISEETLTQLITILENKNKMVNKDIFRVLRVDLHIDNYMKIYNIACKAWRPKLMLYMQNNLSVDGNYVGVSRTFYDSMISDCTLDQLLIVQGLFPEFNVVDPYQKFKDASKEGKIVQVKIGKAWIDITNNNYVFVNPVKYYRIKHVHQHLIDEWEASGRTLIVESLKSAVLKKWTKEDTPNWDPAKTYRIKKEEKYEPLTYEEISTMVGTVIKGKACKDTLMILGCQESSVIVSGNGYVSNKALLYNFTTTDGKPLGKLKQ